MSLLKIGTYSHLITEQKKSQGVLIGVTYISSILLSHSSFVFLLPLQNIPATYGTALSSMEYFCRDTRQVVGMLRQLNEEQLEELDSAVGMMRHINEDTGGIELSGGYDEALERKLLGDLDLMV